MPDPQRPNAEIEMIWVNAWSDLHELVGDRHNVDCILPDSTVVTVSDCKSWLQDSAYAGYSLTLAETLHEGRKAVAANRTKQ